MCDECGVPQVVMCRSTLCLTEFRVVMMSPDMTTKSSCRSSISCLSASLLVLIMSMLFVIEIMSLFTLSKSALMLRNAVSFTEGV